MVREHTMVFEKEINLFEPVSLFLRERGFFYLKSELNFYDYKIDIYGYSAKKNLTIAIELKLYNWRKAFKQALIYQLCSDLVLIAVPFYTVKNIDLNSLDKYGIGLLSIDKFGLCEEIKRSIASSEIRKEYREDNISLLKGEI